MMCAKIVRRSQTRAAKADDGGGGRFGMDDEEAKGRVGEVREEEVVESPLEGVGAVGAVVDAHHHHRLLHRCSHRRSNVSSEEKRERMRKSW